MIVFGPTETAGVVPAGAVTLTMRVPVAAPLATVTVAVNRVPSELTVRFDAVIAVSADPLESKKRIIEAPARFAPLIVSVTVAPRVKLAGEMLEMFGPVVADTKGLNTVAALPMTAPRRTDKSGLETVLGPLMTAPFRTDKSGLKTVFGPLMTAPRLTETSGARAAATPRGSPFLIDTGGENNAPKLFGFRTRTCASPNSVGWATLVARTTTERC